MNDDLSTWQPDSGSDLSTWRPEGEQPITAEGSYRAVEEGAQRGVAGLASLPHGIQTAAQAADPYVVRAGNWLVDKLGLPESMRPDTQNRQATINWPTYEQEREAIRRDYGGLPEYQPQNRLERGLTTAGEFLPNVVGPGGFVRGVAQALVPAAATDVVREAGGGPVAQALAGMAGGYGVARTAAGAAERAAVRALPTMAELKDVAQQQGYRPIEQAALQETLTPLQAANTYGTITRVLDASNIRPDKFGKVYEALAPLEKAPDMATFMNAREMLGGIGGKQRVGALQARDMVDTALEARMPGSIRTLQIADQNYNAFKVATGLDKAIRDTLAQTSATWSGMNVGNKMRQLSAALAKNDKVTRYLKPEETQALLDAAKGTWTQFSLRLVSNLLGGGGGLGALTTAGLGHLVAGPAGWALPAAGFTTRALYNRLARNQMARIQQQVLARSPEAIARGAGLPQRAGPFSGVPAGVASGYLGSLAGQ